MGCLESVKYHAGISNKNSIIPFQAANLAQTHHPRQYNFYTASSYYTDSYGLAELSPL